MQPRRSWAGIVLTALPVLFLLFDSAIHLMVIPPVVESFTQLGYPVSTARALGVIELVCIALYLIPRTSVLGAVLMTGYLGGAVADNLRAGRPIFIPTLFPDHIGLLTLAGT